MPVGITEAANFRTGRLRKVNTTGGKRWTRKFGSVSGASFDPSGLIQTTDDGYAFVVSTGGKQSLFGDRWTWDKKN